MKALLDELESKHPTLRQTMLAALGNVNPSHLLRCAGSTTADAGSARANALVAVSAPAAVAPTPSRGRELGLRPGGARLQRRAAVSGPLSDPGGRLMVPRGRARAIASTSSIVRTG